MTMLPSPTNRQWWTLTLVVALSSTAAASCGRAAAPAAVQTAAPASNAAPAPQAIDVSRVVQQPLDVTLSLPAELTAYRDVAIHARVAGFVKRIDVDRGSVVREGELLATIEAPELLAQRAEAQSKLQAAEAQLASAQARADADRSTDERLKAAAATPGVVAGNDVLLADKAAEASRSQVDASRQQVEAARQAARAVEDLESYLRITAPFAGVITERRAHPGALVGPASEPLLQLVDQRRLRLVVPVPEAYSAAVTVGTAIRFTVAAFPGRAWTGTLARSARSVNVTTRTMAVELDVENGEGQLAPGTFCQVQWPVHRTAPSLFVPSGSIASTTDRTFVIRVRGGKAEWVDVKTGLTAGPLVEVFGDLGPGDEIASRGTDEVRPGTAVRPRDAKPAA